jgi:hypothetical protein
MSYKVQPAGSLKKTRGEYAGKPRDGIENKWVENVRNRPSRDVVEKTVSYT